MKKIIGTILLLGSISAQAGWYTLPENGYCRIDILEKPDSDENFHKEDFMDCSIPKDESKYKVLFTAPDSETGKDFVSKYCIREAGLWFQVNHNSSQGVCVIDKVS